MPRPKLPTLAIAAATVAAGALAVDAGDRGAADPGRPGGAAVRAVHMAPPAAVGGPSGRLDRSFGRGGRVVTDLAKGSSDDARAVAVQPDGRILVAGGSDGRLALARYLHDGTLDDTFGRRGRVVSDEIRGVAHAVVLQPDGRIVVSVGDTELGDAVHVARYLPDGVLDRSFGAGGRTQIEAVDDWDGEGCIEGKGLAQQPDGRTVLVGYAGCYGEGSTQGPTAFAARLDPAGGLDRSFDGDGTKLYENLSFELSSVAVLPDGTALVVGSRCGAGGGDAFCVARLRPEGAIGGSFGRRGRADVPFGLARAYAVDLAVDRRGRAVIVGVADRGEGTPARPALAVLTSRGRLDRSFGSDGTVLGRTGQRRLAGAGAVALAGDGRIVVVGAVGPSGRSSAVGVAVYRPTGRPDTSFGPDGVRPLRFGGVRESANDVAVDARGRAVVVGSSTRRGTEQRDVAIAVYRARG